MKRVAHCGYGQLDQATISRIRSPDERRRMRRYAKRAERWRARERDQTPTEPVTEPKDDS